MSEDPFGMDPLFRAMFRAQKQFLDSQAPYWKRLSETVDSSKGGDQIAVLEKSWEETCALAYNWINLISRSVHTDNLESESNIQETLCRMMDPEQFLFAGSDEISQTIQKLVAGPEFADIGILERHSLKISREWLNLRQASGEYRMLVSKAWKRAFDKFTNEINVEPELSKSSFKDLIDRWLEIANDELVYMQRTIEFLDTQRKLLRAGVEYRLRTREIAELWCETHSMPTRTEVDDLHKSVYQLKRELRDVRKKLAVLGNRSSVSAKTRKAAAKSKVEGNA